MVTVARSGLPTVNPVGNEDWSIVRSKFSSMSSNIVSLLIETSNVMLVTPAGNVIVYGPEP